jgi:hypothetical protein
MRAGTRPGRTVPRGHSTAWTPPPSRSHHLPVRVLAHIRKLDDCFGQFLVRLTCESRSRGEHSQAGPPVGKSDETRHRHRGSAEL